MPEITLIEGRISAGVWRGLVRTTAADAPVIEIRHAGGVLQASLCERAGPSADLWRIEVPLSADLLDEGARSLLIVNGENGQILLAVTASAGAPLPEDLIAEVATLRAELDMLKSVLRRHMRLSEK